MTKRNRETGASAPSFWRDDALPFIEARSITDGREVCYARHAHDTFSIGAITGGRSVYVNGRDARAVGAGMVVVMNPGDVHCCNPVQDEPWSYLMCYVDAKWLAAIQFELNPAAGPGFQRVSTEPVTNPELFAGLVRLHELITDPQEDHLRKESALIGFFSALPTFFDPAPASEQKDAGHKILLAAEYIRQNFARQLRLDEICAAAGLSAPYLIRAFKSRYDMTPHAYLINARIEFCREQLKRGEPIADVALNAGFADQAHLQRAFKQFVAATPGQYRARP
jgi:AraC-like DNA-binding protein